MTIQIDDAGWGCPVGGVAIGVYRVETQEFAHQVLPVTLFQPPAFQRRDYLAAAADATRALLAELQAPDDEPAEVCSGYVLGGVREWLAESGRPWETAKVTGPLQVLVEAAFLQHLHALDRELQVITAADLERPGLLFWKCIRWLKDGRLEGRGMVPDRERHAKTGWGTWQFYRRLPYEEAKTAARRYKAQQRRARWQRSR